MKIVEFKFKNGVHAFACRLNQVIDQLDPIEETLLHTLLAIAVAPEENVTVVALQNELGLTTDELSFYMNRLDHLGLITWTADRAVVP
ncbi:hypothetical protein ACUIJQ_05645 [Levilactobacillus hammesii]|uniref:Uncharacterized protein n=1 Tax=Levilactobacillus hammesii DSM 16381 TaxID=1423753 RepID=A0A0R1UWI0_9LACO|nr:hypothetical protein [Levilactobacillus hammesii]KRL97613.1 hypothetical protein FD28_GL001699 [Levilactobacillus hammesii DSM 16381]